MKMRILNYPENYILNKLKISKIDHLEYLRLKFGISIIGDFLKKGTIIYGFSLLFNCFAEMLIIHMSFLIIRQVSFGWHSTNNLACLFWSILIFPIFAVVLKLNFIINSHSIYIIIISSSVLIYLIGPVTNVNRIMSLDTKKKLQRKLGLRLVVLFLICFLTNEYLTYYICIGILIQTFAIIAQIIKNGLILYDEKAKKNHKIFLNFNVKNNYFEN